MATQAQHGTRALGKNRAALRGELSNKLHWPRTLIEKKQRALSSEHFQYKTKIARSGVLHFFLVDCSGSMRAANQLALAQGALRHLHQRAYQQRADIALISYAGEQAITRIYPTAARPFNTLHINAWLPALQAGGGTPFARGVTAADALIAQRKYRKPEQQCWLWLLSDGRSNEMPERPAHADVLMVIDCEQQRIALNRCKKIADYWQADYQTLNDLII
ncbi:MAG: von willebrand factor type a [Verrucomicrobiaceae bacterium]|nr:von willebrand factor type a [Verrucomicrobiaceae bacterium]